MLALPGRGKLVSVNLGTQHALEALGAAFVLALALTPLSALLARRVGLVDRPGGESRRLHENVIPFGGGLAMLVAILVPIYALHPYLNGRRPAIVLGAVLCVVLGLIDDRFSLPPIAKLIGEVGIAAIPVWAGTTIDHVTLPLLGPFDLGAWQYPITILWIVGLMNSLNFIDGMDGLAAGIGAITSITFCLLALRLGKTGAATVSAAVAGSCLGFLRHNFHPARVFMGDAGALLLGYLLATMSVQGVLKTTAAVALAGPLLILLVPLLDTSFVVLHRLKYGKAPWNADANHLHHRFMRVGYGQKQATLLVYLWCGLLAGCAITLNFAHRHGNWDAGLTALLVVVSLAAVAVTLWIVLVLEVIKQRHLQLLGFGRRRETPGSTPAIELWRRRDAEARR